MEEEKVPEPLEVPKCKSTTPTKQRVRKHTWSHVKVLIKKSLGEKKLAAQAQAESKTHHHNHPPAPAPSPADGGTGPDLFPHSASTSSSDDLSLPETELKVPRPTDLPIPPLRSKKKTAAPVPAKKGSGSGGSGGSSSVSKKGSKCMDLRGAEGSSSLTGLMKKIRKSPPPSSVVCSSLVVGEPMPEKHTPFFFLYELSF
jgi:hypothetical protein